MSAFLMLPNDVQTLVFAINSSHYTFQTIEGDIVRIVDTNTEQDYFSHYLADGGKYGDHHTFIFAKLARNGEKWELHETSEYIEVDADKDSPHDDTIDYIIRNRFL